VIPRDLRPQVHDLFEQFLLLDDPFDQCEDLVDIEGLRNVVGGPQLDRFDRGLHRFDRRDDHHLGLVVQVPDAP